jgi:hypothetical protein
MNIAPNKVIDAIAALEAASTALLSVKHTDENLGRVAGECIKAAADLQASVQIAGLTHTVYHLTGTLN